MRMPESLKTDTDFERLSPLFSQDYLDHLEESIKAHGCLDPIDIWDGIILNGYKRYRICLKLKIEMPINEKVFACKEDAITWLCYEHLKSASVTQETGVYLIGKHYLAQRQKYFHEQPPSFTKRSTFVYSTAEEVSKIYHLSSGTVYKYGIYAENLDSIYDRDRQLAEYVLSGKLKVSHKTIQLMTTVQDAKERRSGSMGYAEALVTFYAKGTRGGKNNLSLEKLYSYMTEQARKHKSSTSRIKKIAAEAQENAANDTDLGEVDKENAQLDLPIEA